MKNLLPALCLLFIFGGNVFADNNPELKKFLKPRWSKNLDIEADSGNLSIGNAAAVIGNGAVYTGSLRNDFIKFDLKSGRLLWKRKVQSPMQSAPVIYKDKVIFGTLLGRVYALDTQSGSTIYEIDLGSGIASRPVIYSDRLIIQTANHSVACLDGTTGKILWTYQRQVPSGTTLDGAAAPARDREDLFFGHADGHLTNINIHTGKVQWEKEIYTKETPRDVDFGPIFIQGKIIVAPNEGDLHILTSKDGSIFKKFPYRVSSPPILHKGTIWFGSADGYVYNLRPNGEILTKEKVSNHAVTTVNVWQKKVVYLTSEGKLFLSDPQKPSLKIDSFDFGTTYSQTYSGINIEDQRMVILTSRSRLYLF